MKIFLLLLLHIYKFGISPLLGKNCRFYPSCSDYAIETINKYGVLQGGILSMKRFFKCQPWHAGGIDLVSFDSTPTLIINYYSGHP